MGWIGIRKLLEGTIEMGALGIGIGRGILGFSRSWIFLSIPDTMRQISCFVRISPVSGSYFIWEFRLRNRLKLWVCKFASNLAIWLIHCFCTFILGISFLWVCLVSAATSSRLVSLFITEVARALLVADGVVYKVSKIQDLTEK